MVDLDEWAPAAAPPPPPPPASSSSAKVVRCACFYSFFRLLVQCVVQEIEIKHCQQSPGMEVDEFFDPELEKVLSAACPPSLCAVA